MLRLLGDLFFIVVAVLCAAPAWGEECSPSSDYVAKLGTVAPVVSYMIRHESPELAKSCYLPGQDNSKTIVAECLASINDELTRRYGRISDKIKTSMVQINEVSLGADATGTLQCGRPTEKSDGKKTVTTAPVHLPYHIAPADPKAQSADLDKMMRALKLGTSPNPTLDSTALLRLTLGRGTAADYRHVVRQLACVSDSGFDTPGGAEAALASAGIGIDCSGAVQVALRDATDKSDNGALGLQYPTSEAFHADSLNKIPQHFRHSMDPLSIRPGDIIPLDRPNKKTVGHVVIAEDVHFELAKKDLIVTDSKVSPKTGVPLSFETKSDDQLMVMKVGSSWGGAGPSTETWVYNMRTHQWAAQKADGTYYFDVSGPYNHPYLGQYRSKALTP